MIKYKAHISGLRETIQKIEKYSKQMADDVDNELSIGTQNAAALARTLAPKGRTLALVSSISADVSKRYDKSFTAHAPYSAYAEFGTGSRVFEAKSGFMFTPEMKEFAREFYVNGRGRMPASPFMFPALETEKLQIIQRIKKVLLKGVNV